MRSCLAPRDARGLLGPSRGACARDRGLAMLPTACPMWTDVFRLQNPLAGNAGSSSKHRKQFRCFHQAGTWIPGRFVTRSRCPWPSHPALPSLPLPHGPSVARQLHCVDDLRRVSGGRICHADRAAVARGCGGGAPASHPHRHERAQPSPCPPQAAGHAGFNFVSRLICCFYSFSQDTSKYRDASDKCSHITPPNAAPPVHHPSEPAWGIHRAIPSPAWGQWQPRAGGGTLDLAVAKS